MKLRYRRTAARQDETPQTLAHLTLIVASGPCRQAKSESSMARRPRIEPLTWKASGCSRSRSTRRSSKGTDR